MVFLKDISGEINCSEREHFYKIQGKNKFLENANENFGKIRKGVFSNSLEAFWRKQHRAENRISDAFFVHGFQPKSFVS